NIRLLILGARGLLAPLGAQVQPHEPQPPLGNAEIEALWQLASSPEKELYRRFIEEALRSPVPTRQLRDRRGYALQAAVGLDARRRTEAEQLLGQRLAAPETSAEQQRDVALILVEL